MAIVEAFRARNRVPAFRVFATDVHGASLEAASTGIYSAESAARVPPALREAYFRPHRDGFQVSPDLRSHVVFAHHNMLRDAPFTRLDIVSCRNVLIYSVGGHAAQGAGGLSLRAQAQRRAGPGAERVPVVAGRGVRRRRRALEAVPQAARRAHRAGAAGRAVVRDGDARRRFRAGPPRMRGSRNAASCCSANTGRPRLLVDGDLRLLHAFNAASEFLTPKDGRPSLNLMDLVDGELKAVLAAAIRRAQRDARTVRLEGINVTTNKTQRQVCVVVRPIPGNGMTEDAWSISLEPSALVERDAPLPGGASDRGELMTERVANLEGELRYAKENLQATIEEMETGNEELQATNEELIASNEELQSTNEELHSVNEELYTVNAEYQSKIAELTELTADMTHLLEATEVHMLFVDRELRLRKFTPKIGDTFHLLPQDIGRRLDSFAHDVEDDHLLRDLEQVLATGQTVEREVRDRGGNCYFLRILPYRRSAKIDGVVLTLIDLSALKRAQRDLSGVLEHSPSFIYLKNTDGRYLVAGRQCLEILGVPAEHVVGRTDEQLLPGPVAQARAACEREVLETGDSAELEEQLVVRGEPRTFLTVVFPLRDLRGKPYAVAGISTDITERKRITDEARGDVQRRDQFLAMLSHELRTPLGAILNATELLERKDTVKSSAAAHDVIRRQTRHMGRLVDDLLDVGRITREQLVLQTQIVDLRQLVQEVVEIARREADRKNLELRAATSNEELTVRGDPVRLRQMVTNLIANAITYTPAGLVDVKAGRSNGTVNLTVRDTGVGLGPDELPHVFELFYQAPQPLDRPRGGLGVGLSLAHKLVTLHDGTIAVNSDGRGKGSVFTVNLPFVAAAPAVAPADARPPKLRIVIVEDNDDNREMLVELLRSEGHDVLSADNGLAGTELILAERPDVALVDVGLPGLDGFGVATRVREQAAGVVRLVALTGYGLPHDRARVSDAGFDRHILKPVEPSALFRVLREVSPTPDGVS